MHQATCGRGCPRRPPRRHHHPPRTQTKPRARTVPRFQRLWLITAAQVWGGDVPTQDPEGGFGFAGTAAKPGNGCEPWHPPARPSGPGVCRKPLHPQNPPLARRSSRSLWGLNPSSRPSSGGPGERGARGRGLGGGNAPAAPTALRRAPFIRWVSKRSASPRAGKKQPVPCGIGVKARRGGPLTPKGAGSCH